MAWTCSASTNEGLVANLLANGLVKTDAVAAAMRKVDRGWFVFQGRGAYEDAPQPIGHGATISAPHMHASMLEILAPYILRVEKGYGDRTAPPLRILDVGSGSGYMTAALAALCEAATPQWQVVGIEHVKELQQQSVRVMERRFPAWLQTKKVCILQGDGRDPAEALRAVAVDSGSSNNNSDSDNSCFFDLIHVGAAADAIPPALTALLRPSGCMVIPVGAQHEVQKLQVCCKDAAGRITIKTDCLVSFVALTSLEHQRGR